MNDSPVTHHLDPSQEPPHPAVAHPQPLSSCRLGAGALLPEMQLWQAIPLPLAQCHPVLSHLASKTRREDTSTAQGQDILTLPRHERRRSLTAPACGSTLPSAQPVGGSAHARGLLALPPRLARPFDAQGCCLWPVAAKAAPHFVPRRPDQIAYRSILMTYLPCAWPARRVARAAEVALGLPPTRREPPRSR
jgi:hypothetical protein